MRSIQQFGVIFEDWLRREVVVVCDGMKDDPSRGKTTAQVRASLEEEHERAKKARR